MAIPNNTPGRDMTITPLLTERALVLVLSGPLDATPASTLTRELLATIDPGTPPRVVLDVRSVEPLPAHVARSLIAFAHAEPGIRCVLLPHPASTTARAALDAADPQRFVPRATTIEQALTEQPHAEPGPPPGTEQVIETVGTEAAEQFLSDTYARVRIHTRGAPSGLRAGSVTIGAARFDRLEFRMNFDADVEPMGRYVFAQLHSGSLALRSAGRERRYLAGDIFLTAHPDVTHRSSIEDGTLTVTMLDPALIAQVAQNEPGRDELVRFTALDPISPRAAATWQTICDITHDTVRANPDMVVHPLVAANTARVLAAAALTAFPNTALTEPTIEDRHDAHPWTLRRAIGFIEANADRDITIADIAGSACVTIRAVQLAFRRHLGTTPTAYLRRVRLDHARAELTAAAPGQDTVTQIAARWGYSRANVFAAHYRAAYDELPSQTLRRL
jgi:AraC-like DNA-binding protein